ncbi:MAG: hypothetical protein IPO15_11135 [Anaerolineae bacterium]|uniref:hypothetical protein n=1 Tax=Candidatus Amarolinea dominans TaxID=3140696 RepID=UPI0031358681|nr:hypothetical protein [Anaerolineae bacterium]
MRLSKASAPSAAAAHQRHRHAPQRAKPSSLLSERGDLTGEHERIYRHYPPINAANLALAQGAPPEAEDPRRFYANPLQCGRAAVTWQPRLR